MARVLVYLMLTLGAGGLVVFAAWHPEVWEPWLEAQGITRESATFRSGLKLALGVLLGVPLTALIYAIGRLGSDKGRTDIHGYTVLRLKAGMLWFTTVGCIGLAALFFAYPMVDPKAPAPWAFQIGGLVWIIVMIILLTARVRYDNSTLIVPNNFGGTKRFDWSDLTEVRDVPPMKTYELIFRDGKKAKLSYSYVGLGPLLGLAQEKLHSAPRRGVYDDLFAMS